MAARTWLGGLAKLATKTPVAQVWSTTVASSTNGQTFSITLTDELGGTVTFSHTASTDTTNTIATALQSAIAASQDPRAVAVTATVNTATVTLTAASPGVPFYAATGGTGSFSGTGNTTVNIGGNDWNTQANWAENVVAVGGDDVTLTGSNAISYGLKTGLALGNFSGAPGSSVACGGPGLYLSFTCTGFFWASTGPSYIDIGSSAISPRIVATAGATAPAGGLNLKGSAIATANVEGGSLDIGVPLGTASTATTVQVSGNGRARCGPSLTLTNLYVDAGSAELDCACTTGTIEGGTLLTTGAGAITTLNINGGTATCNATGTIGTANVNNNGTLDMTQSQVARTINNLVPSRGATVKYDPNIVTVTNKVAPLATQGPITVTVQ